MLLIPRDHGFHELERVTVAHEERMHILESLPGYSAHRVRSAALPDHSQVIPGVRAEYVYRFALPKQVSAALALRQRILE
jgi:hypothetical protein